MSDCQTFIFDIISCGNECHMTDCYICIVYPKYNAGYVSGHRFKIFGQEYNVMICICNFTFSEYNTGASI